MCADLARESAEGDSLCFTTDRLGDRIQDVAKGSPDDLVWRALSYACNYCLGGRGHFTFGPYSPMFVFPEGGDQYNVFPTPLDRVGPDVLEIWADYACAEELHPMPRARLADLLWVRLHGDIKTWITTAVEMNIQAGAIPEIEVSERGDMLARAVVIIKESNNQHKELQAEALTALVGLARVGLHLGDLRRQHRIVLVRRLSRGSLLPAKPQLRNSRAERDRSRHAQRHHHHPLGQEFPSCCVASRSPQDKLQSLGLDRAPAGSTAAGVLAETSPVSRAGCLAPSDPPRPASHLFSAPRPSSG